MNRAVVPIRDFRVSKKGRYYMSGIYNASINMDKNDTVRNTIGMVAAAAMKLKNCGYTDEAVYTIIPILFGIDMKADQKKIDDVDHIIEAIYNPDDTEDADLFLEDLRSLFP